jgi:hypothetical protein
MKDYKLWYKSDKVGKDQFSVDVSWLGRTNEHFHGTLIVNVEVVDAPF